MPAAELLKEIGDTYNRRARIYPGMIVTLPVTVLGIVLVTSKPAWWTGAIFLVGSSGGSYFGSQLVRSAGRRKEQWLWESWGGPPTTQLLRFRGSPNRTAINRRHDQLLRLFPDLSIPDEDAEIVNPELADERYEVAVRALIERTRDRQKFERVFDELCQYGFRRNLWGCRGLALCLSVFGILATAVLAWLRAQGTIQTSLSGLTLAIAVNLLLLLTMAFVVRPDWVRESAEAYAGRLLATLETLA